MKVGTLAALVVGTVVLVAAFAIHFELSARSRVDNELRGLRAEATTDLDDHRISASRAAAIERRLLQARRQIREDDVRKAQTLIDRIKAELGSDTRAA